MPNNIEKALDILQNNQTISGFEKEGYYFLELPVPATPYSMEEVLVDTTDKSITYVVAHSDCFFIEGSQSSQKNLYAFILANTSNIYLTERKCTGRWSLDFSADSIEDAVNTKGSGFFTYVAGIPTSLSAEATAELIRFAIDSFLNTRSKLNKFCKLVNTGQEIPFDFVDRFDVDDINVSLHPEFEKLINQQGEE